MTGSVGSLPSIDVTGGIVAAFEEAVARDPARPAVITTGATVTTATMADLAAAVDRLAVALEGLGATSVLVTPRDPRALVTGVIAARRAGATSIVADPTRPHGVLRGLAERIGATAIVADVDEQPVRIAATSGTPSEATVHATVCVPTSGTTGDPGLVGLTEEALLAMAVEAVDLGIVQPGDRVARVASHLGIGPLLTAVLLDLPYVGLDVRRLTRSGLLPLLTEQGVSYLHLAPTLLRTLLPFGAPGSTTSAAPPVRLVGSGGEGLRWSDVALVRRVLGDDVTVLHTYSSTEAGMVTRRLVRPSDDPPSDGATLVPVGAPLPGRDVWIDAGDGTPAPAGVVGEIVVDGAFGTVTPRVQALPDGRQRLRTGDLGMLRADGTLELAGRVGRDGKVGMWRVDLARVEAAIAAVEGVVDVAVRVEGEGPSSQRLVAHVVLDGRIPVDDAVLRDAVGALAPAAAPRRIVRHVGGLPTLASGKVDGRGLAP